jgi:hypothetical protein
MAPKRSEDVCSLLGEPRSVITRKCAAWLDRDIIFRRVKAREGWRRDHIHRSYHSEFNTRQRLSKDHRRRGKRKIDKTRGRRVPWRCMTLRNFTTTFEDGRMRTCRFPRRSALTMLFCKILRSEKRDVVDEAPLARQSFYVREEA